MEARLKFIVDQNVGKLVRWLRLLGFDTLFFQGPDDSDLVTTALAENRIVLTRDTHILERRLITKGQVQALLIHTDASGEQIKQVLKNLAVARDAMQPFSRCLEDNGVLDKKTKNEVRDRVPPYVYKTQEQYMECPVCHRIYWRGTHWEKMVSRIARLP